MTDKELLLAISDIVTKNTKVLERRIDRVEDSLNQRIDEVEASLNNKIDEVEASLNNKIDEVDRRLTNQMEVLDCKLDAIDERLSGNVNDVLMRMENVIEPRMNTIEKCYISTYDRYRDGVDKIETLEMNMSVVQSVVKEHGEKLNTLTA